MEKIRVPNIHQCLKILKTYFENSTAEEELNKQAEKALEYLDFYLDGAPKTEELDGCQKTEPIRY